MLLEKLPPFIQLMRLDKPIGILLLLWPTLWGLWLAADGTPSVYIFLIFILGTLIMRSLGCVLNDLSDARFDRHVKRTAKRPLATGICSRRAAWLLAMCLAVLALSLLFFLNTLTQLLALIALGLAALYPLLKRVTHWPQAWLGAAFSAGIPMAFAAIQNSIPITAWWLVAANIAWVISYDTFYAMVDRDDDIKLGLHSTAILFGQYDQLITAGLQCLTLLILSTVGWSLSLSWPFYVSLCVAAGLMTYQQWLVHHRERSACFAAFLHNQWVGLSIFVGIALSLGVR